jgi:predicted RNase H-like nuclease (RuvC/YqgF family)
VSHEMTMEDFVRNRDAELISLREDLQRARMTIERQEQEIDTLYRAAQAATRENLDLRHRLQGFYDEADEDIRRDALRRAEAEALEL